MNIDKSDIKILFIGKVLSEILLKKCNCKLFVLFSIYHGAKLPYCTYIHLFFALQRLKMLPISLGLVMIASLLLGTNTVQSMPEHKLYAAGAKDSDTRE